MKLKLALIVLLLIAALLVSGCCCCCTIPSHRGYYRAPCLMRDMGHSMAKVTATAVPALSPTPVK